MRLPPLLAAPLLLLGCALAAAAGPTAPAPPAPPTARQAPAPVHAVVAHSGAQTADARAGAAPRSDRHAGVHRTATTPAADRDAAGAAGAAPRAQVAAHSPAGRPEAPVSASPVSAAGHTVTLVNATDERVWVGSSVNADGSQALEGLPVLDPGASATVTVPEDAPAGHWRGTFFARQGCTGDDGSGFHCAVGDCGPYADHCSTGEQPVSLAEFNFDPADALAPWYDVSYVNAVSVPVTITPDGVDPPPDGGECAEQGCTEPLLPYCPPEDLTSDPATGRPLVCVNPNRDAPTPYSDALNAHCPRAYAWSGNDTVPGNQVMRQCPACSGLTVTFH